MTMRNSKNTFETFNDGICLFCEIDDDGNVGKEKEKLRYGEKTVGINRYYEAMTNKMQIDRMIRVVFRPWLTTEYLAVIKGQVYEILQVQMIPDSLPKSLNVSLHIARQREYKDGTV